MHDERVKRRKGLWLTNTHVSLETAYAMCAGITAMVLGEHFISGLYWETDHGDHSTRDVSEMSPQFREYVDAVRADGLGGAVPESCRANPMLRCSEGHQRPRARCAACSNSCRETSPSLFHTWSRASASLVGQSNSAHTGSGTFRSEVTVRVC